MFLNGVISCWQKMGVQLLIMLLLVVIFLILTITPQALAVECLKWREMAKNGESP